MPLLPVLLALPVFYGRLGFTQQVTAISQAPGFTALPSCAQNIAVAVIDHSNSPDCPGGSPPKCYCAAEAASQEYSDQISTNILNFCDNSPRPEATQAASVFAAYCSLGVVTTASTVTNTATGTNVATSSGGGSSSASVSSPSGSPTSQSSSSNQQGGWNGLSHVAQIFTILGPIIAIVLFLIGLCIETQRRKKKKAKAKAKANSG